MAKPGIHEELDHLVQALSHDMSASFLLLENSFARLKRSIDDPSRCDHQRLIAHVEACLRQSKRYLDDLAGLAKTGRMAMEPSAVDPGAVLEEVLFEQRDLLRDRGVKVDVRRPLPAAWCNPHRLKQILFNLVRNAVLHGCDRRAPTVTISAKPLAGRRGARMVAFRVHDNGPGIEPRFHKEIFLPGRRLSDAASDGSGMGLAIVKRIVEHYGGQVNVDRQCQAGTAIVFSLPAIEEPSARQLPRNRPAGSQHANRSVEPDKPHQQGEFHAHQPLQKPAGIRR